MSAGFTASAAFTASFWEGFGSLGPKPGGGILGVEKAVDRCTSTGRSQDADGRWRELSQCVRMQPVKTKRGRGLTGSVGGRTCEVARAARLVLLAALPSVQWTVKILCPLVRCVQQLLRPWPR